jgi:cytochrome b pre-mRNA-processing protein 3
MLSRLFAHDNGDERIATALYGMIVAGARADAFYGALGVPDTVRGRFEMLVLHVVIVIERLRDGDKRNNEIGQLVFDLFCNDMDQSLRELGTGDLSVPKQMRGMAESFYGRAKTYGAALAAGDAGDLAQAIRRNVFNESVSATAAPRLAAYALAAAQRIAGVEIEDVAGGWSFPDATQFADIPAS